MRKLLLVLTGLLLLETLMTPVPLRADGDPGPSCPTHQVCKP